MPYEYDRLHIDGHWHRPADGGTAVLYSPADEQPFGTTPVAGPADVDAAVAAARRALRAPEWAGLRPDERAELLERFAEELAKNAEQRALLTTVQNGMPIGISVHSEGAAPIGLARYHAGLARTTPLEDRRPRFDGAGETVVLREPVGVVAVVVPWNFPQPLAMFKIAPALAAGCTVVVKPAEQTGLGALEIAAAAQRAGLPPGVLNVVTGGADLGRLLVAHPGVDKIAFTGSTPAGREVAEAAGRLMRPVTLHLGGRAAAIVLDDADLADTVRGLAAHALLDGGQACYLSTRILVPAHRHDELLDAVARYAAELPVGDPLDPATRIGPMVSRAHRDRVESYVAAGRAEGATLAAGGTRPEQDRGWYVRPAVFGAVSPSSRIAREEILGPVLALIPYSDLDTAVALANDSEYGLGGTVWTTDPERALDLARRLDTGSVGVNYYDVDLSAPYAGRGNSGLGHELGPEGLATYQRFKSVYFPNHGPDHVPNR
ncbi:aldehyde dehydrogenase [Streptomyces sp. FH025]|uniref:aldehyde dehydrogenase n=1 Tax=Streptomyces sp. FH025 TaxID=2815937 RepID=UPI001A9DED3E|nr:aldehyde dehydrogenase [Streptomyces sp. FH025]MBO1413262.1 aldehyde dehydrogenase [Streptomyces sp. FH025]